MAKLKILYVDDDHDIRDVVELSLGLDPDVEVRVAAGGAEALDILGQEDWRPDAILLDVMMPKLDGPSLLQEIRRRDELAGIPAIFLTARVQPETRASLLGLGARGVIAKPFDPVTLAAAVRGILGSP